MFKNSKKILEFSYSVDLIAVGMQSQEKGVPLFDIAVYLAHKKIRYTQCYHDGNLYIFVKITTCWGK